MHKANQKTLFDLLNRTRSPKPQKLVPAQQVEILQLTCINCGRRITPQQYASDFCPWCGAYGLSLPF